VDLSQVTLVILSHNRQHCLKQTLKFYENLSLNILVMDNSPLPLGGEFLPKNCRYFNSDEPFATRSAMAAELIETPYTIIGADDEIYLPTSLKKMQEFLDNNQDYVAAGGYALAIWEYGPTIAASWAYKRTYRYHNNADTPLERIRTHTGDGSDPLTSFFTCNLTRTWAAQECLSMYAKAPVLATDAISVLTICGAGKSKYLDLVYWIRNWNQSPRSHAGWDRRVFLHEWWRNPENINARDIFIEDLSSVYRKYTSEDNFSTAWDLILKSDEALQKRVPLIKIKIRSWSEYRTFKRLKYFIKRMINQRLLPTTISDLVREMDSLNIFVPELELDKATALVSKLLPYESW
jgi:glycosyltransferase domain-containing protein